MAFHLVLFLFEWYPLFFDSWDALMKSKLASVIRYPWAIRKLTRGLAEELPRNVPSFSPRSTNGDPDTTEHHPGEQISPGCRTCEVARGVLTSCWIIAGRIRANERDTLYRYLASHLMKYAKGLTRIAGYDHSIR